MNALVLWQLTLMFAVSIPKSSVLVTQPDLESLHKASCHRLCTVNWHCSHSMWSRVCVLVGRPSVPYHLPAAGLLLWALQAGDIDQLLHARLAGSSNGVVRRHLAANACSVTLIADRGSWTQTSCSYMLHRSVLLQLMLELLLVLCVITKSVISVSFILFDFLSYMFLTVWHIQTFTGRP